VLKLEIENTGGDGFVRMLQSKEEVRKGLVKINANRFRLLSVYSCAQTEETPRNSPNNMIVGLNLFKDSSSIGFRQKISLLIL
jgi:hypothetical protein